MGDWKQERPEWCPHQDCGFCPVAKWISVAVGLPTDGEEVDTKIDDANGLRNEQSLVRQGNLWLFPDLSMYVYYAPTHWRDPEHNEHG